MKTMIRSAPCRISGPGLARRAVAAAVCGLVSLTTACGVFESSKPPPTTIDPKAPPPVGAVVNNAPTTTAGAKGEFVQQANAICAGMDAAIKARPQPKAKVGKEAADFFAASANESEAGLAKLRALPAPPGDEAVIADMFAGVDALIPLIRQAAAASRSGNVAAVDAKFAEVAAASKPVNAKFNAYGLVECGK